MLLPTLLQHVVVMLLVIKPLALLTAGSVTGGDGKPDALTADDHGDPGDFGCRSIHDNDDGGDFDRRSHDHSCTDLGCSEFSYGDWRRRYWSACVAVVVPATTASKSSNFR